MNIIDSGSKAKHYNFAKWQFDPIVGTLLSNQTSVRLQPKLAKLLTIFLENVGVLLTREVLIDVLWEDKSVNEDALSRCIAQLRATLGDDSNIPIFIETVPKKGYRFIHPLKSARRMKIPSSFALAAAILVVFVSIGAWYYSPLEQPDASVQRQLTNQLTLAVIAAKRITADTAVEYQPELSSLGDKIAFSVSQAQRLTIKVMTTTGDLQHEISDPESHLYSATFSPDDQALVFVGLSDSSCHIFHYQLATSQREIIANCSERYLPSILDWSSDGERIAYVAKSQHSSNEAIWIYTLANKQHLQITFPDELSIYDTRPRFSADGKKLSFLRGTNSINNVYMTELNSTQETVVLTKDMGFINSFDWLNDQRHIIYDSNALGQKNLWLLDIGNKTQELLGARDGQNPSLNADNSLLAHQEILNNANIWKVDISKSDGVPERIIESIKYNNFPTYSPNGEKIAFVSNRQGRAAIWLYDVNANSQRKLMALPELDLTSPSWSKDGQQLLVSSRGENGYRCFQVDVVSGLYKALSAIKQAHYGCAFASNGDILAIEKEPLKVNQLLRVDSAGKLHVLTKSSISRILLTDMDRIIFSLSNEGGLYVMDLDGKNRQTVVENFDSSYDGHWTVQGSYLYFAKTQAEKGVWQRNLLTQEERMVTNELPSAIGLTMSVNPQHSHLLFTKTDSRVSDIYISDLTQLSSKDQIHLDNHGVGDK